MTDPWISQTRHPKVTITAQFETGGACTLIVERPQADGPWRLFEDEGVRNSTWRATFLVIPTEDGYRVFQLTEVTADLSAADGGEA